MGAGVGAARARAGPKQWRVADDLRESVQVSQHAPPVRRPVHALEGLRVWRAEQEQRAQTRAPVGDTVSLSAEAVTALADGRNSGTASARAPDVAPAQPSAQDGSVAAVAHAAEQEARPALPADARETEDASAGEAPGLIVASASERSERATGPIPLRPRLGASLRAYQANARPTA